MRSVKLFFLAIFLIALAVPCSAQRDARTSSARATYAPPSPNSPHYSKKKKSKKRIKSNSARKSRRNTDAARERRKGIGM